MVFIRCTGGHFEIVNARILEVTAIYTNQSSSWSQRIHRGPRFLKMMSPDDFIMIFAFVSYLSFPPSPPSPQNAQTRLFQHP